MAAQRTIDALELLREVERLRSALEVLVRTQCCLGCPHRTDEGECCTCGVVAAETDVRSYVTRVLRDQGAT